MKKLLSFLAGFTLLIMGQAFAETAYDFEFAGEDGKTYSLSEYKGKVIVVMNTATQCGFAPQYSGMQKLWEKYGEDKLAVIGVASDSFNYKEPLDNDKMRQVCRDRFGVYYPIMDKVEIGGQNQHPFFEWTSSEGFKVDWNFNKIVINKDGEIVKRLGRKVEPMKGWGSVEATVKKHL